MNLCSAMDDKISPPCGQESGSSADVDASGLVSKVERSCSSYIFVKREASIMRRGVAVSQHLDTYFHVTSKENDAQVLSLCMICT